MLSHGHNLVISDENEKLEARSIDNDVIALCCVMGSAQQLFGSFDMAGNNGIPNVFVPPNVQPHHGANGNGTVPEQPKPAENIKVQIAIKKCLFQGVPGGPMVDVGQVGEAPELTKIAQAVVLHSDPPVHKCNLDNVAILCDAPTDDSPGSRQFVKVLKQAARPANVQPNPPNPPQPNPPQPDPPQPNPPQPHGGGDGGVDVETVESDEESTGSNHPPRPMSRHQATMDALSEKHAAHEPQADKVVVVPLRWWMG